MGVGSDSGSDARRMRCLKALCLSSSKQESFRYKENMGVKGSGRHGVGTVLGALPGGKVMLTSGGPSRTLSRPLGGLTHACSLSCLL